MRSGDGVVHRSDGVTIVRGEEELYERTVHLFQNVTEFACAANDLASWVAERRPGELDALAQQRAGSISVRKIYRSSLLLDPSASNELARRRDELKAQIRVTGDEINETIILDRRVVILAGGLGSGQRSYSVISEPETVQGVMSLFETAWRSATDLDAYDAQIAEIRQLAPAVLDLLGQGVKDEAAARMLGMSVRTYRRRVAELMDALGAGSRFQAGVRARELGLT